MSPSPSPVAAIVGVGEGLGYALGKRFAEGGYQVALAARHVIGGAREAGELDAKRAMLEGAELAARL